MAEELSKIQNDQYGLLADFQKFTGQYFGIGSNSSDEVPENTKLGLFGYMNEIVAHATKVSMFHRNALYNEIALNTASIPETIYSAATDEGIDAMEAIPAKATITLLLPSVSLFNLIKSTPTGIIKLDRESFVVNMDNTYFHLPFSVYIRPAGEGVIAFYNSVDFTYGDRLYPAETVLLSGTEHYKNNQYVEATILPDEESTDGKRYIMLKLDVYQYEVYTETHDLSSSNLANSISFQVDLDDQLAGFTVFYKEEDDEDYKPIEKYQSRSLVVSDNPYCSYNFIDENSYQVMFDLTATGWRPANGSSALVKSCTTTGSEGNFNFIGDISIDDPNINIDMTGYICLQPSGGKDRPSIQELKQAVYNKRQKVEVLSTEEDLNTYFAGLSNSVFNGISKVLFKRKRDDLITRLFEGYLLLGDSKGRAFPTNTALMLKTSGFVDGGETANNVVISASDPIIPVYGTPNSDGVIEGNGIADSSVTTFEESRTNFRAIDPTTENLSDLITNGHHIYFSPFVIQCFNGNSWRYFDLTINELKVPVFKIVNTDSESNPILNYLKVRRSISATNNEGEGINVANKLVDDHISVELATNFIFEPDHEKTFLVIFSNNVFPDQKLGILYEASTDENPAKSNFAQMIVDKEFRQDTGSVPYLTVNHVCTTETSQKCWMFNMVDGNRILEEGETGTGTTVKLEENVSVKIYILENHSKLATSPYGALTDYPDLLKCVTKARNGEYPAEAAQYFDTDTYRVKAVAEVDDKIQMFRCMDDVFSSKYAESSGYLRDVPLVGAEVAFNDKYYEEFIQEYKSYLDALKDSISHLVNNTDITVKFFNSYGPSNRWKIRTTTLEQEEENLPIVNASDLEVWIDLEREGGQDDAVEATVKSIVEDFFKDLNTMADADLIVNSKVSMTKLTTAIEKAVPSVSAANVIQINGIQDPRFIVLNPEAYANYPEYTNVGLPINPDETDFPESVRIVFHYTF